MGSNKNPRQIIDGHLRCGSSRHEGTRLRPVEEFCKSKTPDGYSYSCKMCRTKENKQLGSPRYQRYKQQQDKRIYLMLKARRDDARRKNLPFDLSFEDIIIPQHCPVLGIPLLFSERRTYNTPSIDRIDNTKGYTKDNVVICSWRANMLKKDATIEELIKLSNFYERKVQHVEN